LSIAPSTVSHHIKELRQAGIIVVERRGKNIECWVNEEAVKVLRGIFDRGEKTLLNKKTPAEDSMV
jgi:ArsR family transcriptional regulator, arsenate/arsenite/antimonite-responsive transcriptional repressor